MFDHELTAQQKCVRGTLVHGLNNADMDLLDEFENGPTDKLEIQEPIVSNWIACRDDLIRLAQEYERKILVVYPLGNSTPLTQLKSRDQKSNPEAYDLVTDHPGLLPDPDKMRSSSSGVEANVYVWRSDLKDQLKPELWSYREFVEDSLHAWI